MNLLRVGGTALYQSDAFHGSADEYGCLIWQDFALVSFDLPTVATLTASVQHEAEHFLLCSWRFASRSVRWQ